MLCLPGGCDISGWRHGPPDPRPDKRSVDQEPEGEAEWSSSQDR